MKQIILALALLSGFAVRAQDAVRQSNWQQRVDHCITVSLNDTLHRLFGDSKVTYFNNSPDTLREVYYHLWPNGYKDRTTAFARQQLENGKLEFEFSRPEEKGWIGGLRFQAEGKILPVQSPVGEHSDVARIELPRPLLPGESIIITTPFEVQIPGRFSRFGHNEDSYQVTQWYPKPAVYDVNGWNIMPYLDMGEFYSEFGTFEVNITVPANYVVAATGELRTASEKVFIQNRIENPIDPKQKIPSAPETKTLLFIQDSIHDFAWFASKYFNIEYETMQIDGRTVHTYGYAANTKVDLVSGVQQGLSFYSKHVGPYPYGYCSAVIGALEAGGGMEYPMITVLSADTREVIVHEVGHNWFYGILGSNERRYPWMDESINSYFDHECIRLSPFTYSSSIEKPSYLENLTNINDLFMELLAMDAEQKELHQAVGGASEDFTEMNYGTMVYGKGAFLFRQLRRYLGGEVFSKCFHTYYDTWKFRHPLPGDIRDVFERTSGKDLSWFFDDLINSTGHVDYKIKDLKGSYLTVESAGAVRTPFLIGLYKEGNLQQEIAVDAPREDIVGIQLPTTGDFDLVKIDPYQELFEINRQNNSIRTHGIAPRMEPVALNLIAARANPNATQIYWFPALGWNTYDRFMPGVYIGNTSFPSRKWNYRFTPLYSFETEEWNGAAHLSWSNYRYARMWKSELGVKARKFSFERQADPLSFAQLMPFAHWYQRGETMRSGKSASVQLNSYFNTFSTQYDERGRENQISSDQTGRMIWEKPESEWFVEAKLFAGDQRALSPYNTLLRFVVGNYSMNTLRRDTALGVNLSEEIEDMFVQLSIEHEQKFVYNKSGNAVSYRVFGAYFINESDNGYYQFRLGTQAGRYDYLFEHWLPGRGANDGLFSRQMVPNGPNIWLPGNFGSITSWVSTLNLAADLPVKFPVQVYADFFTYNDIQSVSRADRIGYSAGLAFKILPGLLEVRLPLSNSEYLNKIMVIQGFDKWQERISFQLNLNKLNPTTVGKFFM